MRLSKLLVHALFGAMVVALPTASRGQEGSFLSPLDSRPTIRFLEFSQTPASIEVQASFKPPLGEEITRNSYWEVEQTQVPVPPPINDLPVQNLAPPNGNVPAIGGGCCSGGSCPLGGCASGGCASGGCASGGCASGGCASGGCTSGGCAAGGCCGSGDGCTCCDACRCCKPPIQLVAIAEETFFWPQMHRDFITSSITNGGGTQTFRSDSQNGSVDGNMLVGPRLTIGVQGCKWGLYGRYWNGTNWGSGFVPTQPGNALSGMNGFDGFNAYTADLEVARRFVGCRWTNYAFFGARYASVNNDRYLISTNTFGGQLFSSSAYSSQQFSGPGVSFGFWGYRPIHECSPISIYYNNRYSFTFGRGLAVAQTTAAASDINGFATQFNGAEATSDNGSLFIGELQVGAQWNGKITCLPGTALLRCGIEYQYWDSSAGVSASSNSTAFINNNSTINSTTATSHAGDMLFHMFGLNLGAGIMF